jgi:hypothetical protein
MEESPPNIFYSETPLSGPAYGVAYFDCADFDPTVQYCRDTDGGPPQVAVGGPPTQRAVYVSYTRLVPNAEPGLPPEGHLRLGIKSGTQWTFEEPGLHGELHADPQGRAWLGQADALYRRDAPNRWTRIPMPCGVELGIHSPDSEHSGLNSFAIDDAGAVYVASGRSSIWRRDPSGSWKMEATPGPASRVFAGGGTIHYSGIGSRPQDGGGAAGLHYGRRVGTAWQEYDVSAGPSGTIITEYQLELDACGAPHFSVATLDLSTTYYWTLDYVRWTAAGWRSTMVADFLHDPACALGVSRNDANFTYSGGGATVPLR